MFVLKELNGKIDVVRFFFVGYTCLGHRYLNLVVMLN